MMLFCSVCLTTSCLCVLGGSLLCDSSVTPLRFPASFVPVKSFFLLYFFYMADISSLESRSRVWGQRVSPAEAMWSWFWVIYMKIKLICLKWTWFIWHLRAILQQQQPVCAAVSQCSGVKCSSAGTTCRRPAQDLLLKSFNVASPPKLISDFLLLWCSRPKPLFQGLSLVSEWSWFSAGSGHRDPSDRDCRSECFCTSC